MQMPTLRISCYHSLTKTYKLFPLILICRREPYSEPEEQCEGEDGFDEASHVLEGSGLNYRSRRRHGEPDKGDEDERS